MEQYLGPKWYERAEESQQRQDSRNGFYERDYVTPLAIWKTHGQLPRYLNLPEGRLWLEADHLVDDRLSTTQRGAPYELEI